jgi:hypothetical protein
MSSETAKAVFFISGAIAILMLGGAVLVAALNLGGALVTGLMVTIFQIVVTIAAIAIAFIIAGAIVAVLYQSIVVRLAELEMKYHDLLASMKKRSPTVATSLALFATLILLLSDKAFKGETLPTICVGVILTILFWIANELLVSGSRAKAAAGTITWVVGVAILPAAIYIHRGSDVSQVKADVFNLGLPAVVLICAALIVAVLAPIALRSDG